ncbi:MAG: cysteine desulfurase [Acidimicrobiaceae bacterium]|nr:cysteine desulfurase [Acidimicrobiaceae bacterium]HAY51487.1 cysteine desulfurase [Acidimicrobiaceae bacterium]
MIYLDNAASTPIRPEAIDAMTTVLSDCYGNPSGAHKMAREARRLIDDARDTLSHGLGCDPKEVIFTAGGTEADNLAIFGTQGSRDGTILASATDHHAVIAPVEQLGGQFIQVDENGLLDLDHLTHLLDENVALVSVGLVNGETGIIQNLETMAEIVRSKAPKALIHTDAVQAFPWLDVASLTQSADLISIAGHKFGSPKGVGALVVRNGIEISPMQLGGGQELGIRSGTQNTAAIVAMAAAADVTVKNRKVTVERVAKMRDELADSLQKIPQSYETGVQVHNGTADRSHKIAGSCHFCFEGIESEALLFMLEQKNILASAASSCSSGAQDPSHVLAAMGYSRNLAGGSLRLSLGHSTTWEDVDIAMKVVPKFIESLRKTGS